MRVYKRHGAEATPSYILSMITPVWSRDRQHHRPRRCPRHTAKWTGWRVMEFFFWFFANRHLFFRLYSRGRYAPSIILFMAVVSFVSSISRATDVGGNGGTSLPLWFCMAWYFRRQGEKRIWGFLRIRCFFFAYTVGRQIRIKPANKKSSPKLDLIKEKIAGGR